MDARARHNVKRRGDIVELHADARARIVELHVDARAHIVKVQFGASEMSSEPGPRTHEDPER